MEQLKEIAAVIATVLAIVFICALLFSASSDAENRRNAADCKRVAGIEGWVCKREIAKP